MYHLHVSLYTCFFIQLLRSCDWYQYLVAKGVCPALALDFACVFSLQTLRAGFALQPAGQQQHEHVMQARGVLGPLKPREVPQTPK